MTTQHRQVPGPDTAGAERRVAEVTSRTVIGVGPAASRADIVAALRRFGVGAVRLVVVHDDGRLAGVVSRHDLLEP